MSVPLKLPDADARRTAATDFQRNLVVLAGAGTGKTSLLVERVLNAVGSGEAKLEQIAAITFTEKAAGEMRQRLASGLERLRGLARAASALPDEQTEADRAYRHLRDELDLDPQRIAVRALEAMESLDRSTIQTIHAFCAQLLRQYPFEAGVDPSFAVDTGEHLESLFRSFWEEQVIEILSADGPRTAAWTEALRHASLSDLRELTRSLAGFQISRSLLDPEPELGDPQAVLGAHVQQVHDELVSIRHRGEKINKLLDVLSSLGVEALRRFLDQSAGAARRYLKENEDLRRQVAAGFKFGKTITGLEEAPTAESVKKAKALFKVLLNLDDETLHTMSSAVAPVALDFREEYLKTGFIGFDGLLVLTRDLLRDSPKVRMNCSDRFKLLLIDEFQDTDPLQYDIVLLLAAEASPKPLKAFDAKLQPGRLFVVGDAKQSIYRFRGADFTAYHRAIRRIVDQGGECLHLTANFRTIGSLLEPVNAIFEDKDSLWRESTYQPAYEAIHAVRPNDENGAAVEIWSVQSPTKCKALERRAAEGRILAQELVEAHRGGRLDQFGEVTLLFRALTQITPYLRALRGAGIPFVVDGGREFLTRPEVTQWMATVRAVSHPEDRPSLLAFLRSPAGAVSDVELAAFADDGGSWNWRNATVSAERHPRVSRAFALLRRMSERTLDVPVDVAARRILRDSLLLPLGAAAFEGAQRVANLQKLSTAAGELARDGRLSLEDVVEALEQGRLADIQTDRPLADEKADAVRITSIHRMKGLENRWVIVPDLAASRPPVDSVKHWAAGVRLDTDREHLGIHSHPLRNCYRAARELENPYHEEAESLRVYYVALTRARDRLTLIDGSRAMGLKKPPPAVAPLQVWGYDVTSPLAEGQQFANGQVAVRLVSAGEGDSIRLDPKPLDVASATKRYVDAMERLRERAQLPIGAPSGLKSAAASDDTDSREPDSREPAPMGLGKLGLAVGTAVHLALENWDLRSASWDETLARAVAPAAAEHALPVEEVQAEATAIGRGFVDSKFASRLAEIEILGREVPMLNRGEHQAMRGSIDLLYRDADGNVVVADFKTDREPDTRRLAELYRPQLTVYADAVRKAMSLASPPRKELWLIRHGEIVEL